jgi:maltose alpha-D-glucosyltransferase/alpha-amylase
MQVMIELVINHTSDQHPWFQAARRAPKGSPERDMYVWSDSDRLFSGVRIIFTDTEKSNWTWDEEAGAYYWHRFFSHQPDLNFDNPRVMDEVLHAMRFWLDMGVDGLRLDAIPYLVERDGTSCENLEETHVAIRKIRATIDAEYENRLVLAEANMWPADVRPYFGDGDECHMAFHFPLMPRIYMALRQEDRLPITEIMAQTPEIPDTCQWGLFLRNHDELTLEMVTDDERDYMYFAYSADPRMRINVGIRRRLAPLVDNNRRRIELLNSILFSFPGTPILYYGDEIGMGDNIYLGDRNGVRTPMQWNSDRNAGFSRATPARLYSPVIMDPIWGYQAINVEAQESDTSSLLHWTRNMIALRKLFQVFGRGTLEFLKPDNRKVLVYVREYDSERVLCLANLSRFAQPVALDLSRWERMIPVEMLGYVAFPEIKKDLYSITLGPYAFLWLELQSAPQYEADAISAAPVAEVVIPAEDIAGVLSGPGLELLAESFLPKYLIQQRWFGAKARTIQNVTIADWVALPVHDTAILLVDVRYTEGDTERYTVPIALRFESIQVSDHLILGGVRRSGPDTDRDGYLFDALSLDEVRTEILRFIREERSLASQSGVITGYRGKGLGEAPDVLPSRISSAEQSNSSILYGTSWILKIFRRIEEGINPDVEIGRMLTDEAQFRYTPPFAGTILYSTSQVGSEQQSTYVLGLLQGIVKNFGDGWSWSLQQLETSLHQEHRELVQYREAVRLLAKRTAEMHTVLAGAKQADFQAEVASEDKLADDARRLRNQIESTSSLLRQRFVDLPEDLVGEAAALLARKKALIVMADNLASLPPAEAGLWTRIHGDYHLGQVLRTSNDDFSILDFEGEPVKSLEERRKRQSPLRDVAGMLRSFDYVGAAFSRENPGESAWLTENIKEIKGSFLSEYLAERGREFTPAEETMLAAYILEKALYELQYEINHRPDWVMIPLRGILDVLAINL